MSSIRCRDSEAAYRDRSSPAWRGMRQDSDTQIISPTTESPETEALQGRACLSEPLPCDLSG